MGGMSDYEPESDAILTRLAKDSKADLRRVTTFRGERRHRSGRMREITIEIHDAGVEAGGLRWSVIATDGDGRMATGNPEADLRVAISCVHWQHLDADEPDPAH